MTAANTATNGMGLTIATAMPTLIKKAICLF
jgi:hypothetical protein